MTDDGPVRLTRRVAPWFDRAFRTHALGERLTWEITLALAQTEQGPIPHLLVYAQLPAATLGQMHGMAAQMPVFSLSGEQVDRDVAGLVAQLLEARRAELATSNGHGSPPAGGLIVPGA